jgi:hypothetical protein
MLFYFTFTPPDPLTDLRLGEALRPFLLDPVKPVEQVVLFLRQFSGFRA